MTNDKRTIELYRCDHCKNLYDSIGACHGHMGKHSGLIERLYQLIKPNVDHFVKHTTVVKFKAIEERKLEEI